MCTELLFRIITIGRPLYIAIITSSSLLIIQLRNS
jgi:hypothetical protein